MFPRLVPIPMVGQTLPGAQRVGVNRRIEVAPFADDRADGAEAVQIQQGLDLLVGLVIFQQDGSVFQRFAVVEVDELPGSVRVDLGTVVKLGIWW